MHHKSQVHIPSVTLHHSTRPHQSHTLATFTAFCAYIASLWGARGLCSRTRCCCVSALERAPVTFDSKPPQLQCWSNKYRKCKRPGYTNTHTQRANLSVTHPAHMPDMDHDWDLEESKSSHSNSKGTEGNDLDWNDWDEEGDAPQMSNVTQSRGEGRSEGRSGCR